MLAIHQQTEEQRTDRVTEPDPAWESGRDDVTRLQYTKFMTADPIKVDHSKKVELVVRLVAREGRGRPRRIPKGGFQTAVHSASTRCPRVERKWHKEVTCPALPKVAVGSYIPKTCDDDESPYLTICELSVQLDITSFIVQ
ncbi:hypothetical protein OS493_007747 [Desmophyllum pertusum]|uniref:Uncharacterized protein n=1 Tax=Desmophyllum pertusum TaxID=174260 RepID=A0A9X0CP07_9CNID|nr:hypothetical protein OS493_007747 [Desmophyllum pertusum]